MDIAKLGQIAGIAGVAIGAVVILLRPMVKRLSVGTVSARDRARIVMMIAVGAFGIGLAGIAAWIFAGITGRTSVATQGIESPAVIGGRDVFIGAGQASVPVSVVGSPPTSSSSSPSLPSGAHIETHGAQSPGVAAGGNVTIQMERTTPSPGKQESRP